MEWYTTADGKYRIESVSAATVQGALLVIRDYFLMDEPIGFSLDLHQSPQAREQLLEIIANILLYGISLVAVHVETGEVAAFAFNALEENTDSNKEFFDTIIEERCTDPIAKRYMNFIGHLHERFDYFDIYKTECILETPFLGTHREHRNQNLATILCEYSYEIGRRLKYGPNPTAKITVEDLGPKFKHLKPKKTILSKPKAIIMICTAPGSQAIGRKLKYTLHKNISFDGMIFEGKHFIEKIGKYTDHCEFRGKVID